MSILYTQYILHVCQCWERDRSSVALPAGSSIFYSLLKGFFAEVFLYLNQVIRLEWFTCCTNFKAPYGKFVGYMHKTDVNVESFESLWYDFRLCYKCLCAGAWHIPVKHFYYTHILPGLHTVEHTVILHVPLGGRCCATGTTNGSSLAWFVLLANSRVTRKATKNGKSMCKSLLHNPLLQQQAQSAAGCGLNENTPKPSRRLIRNPSPGYSSQNNTTKKIKTPFVPWKSIGPRNSM